LDVSAGYPVHAVARLSRTDNGHGVTLINWTAVCGAVGCLVGSQSRLDAARTALKTELCRDCWPSGHETYHPEPVSDPTLDTGTFGA
jgi:hypothetical protein